MSVVLDSSEDSTRWSGIVIPLMCGSLSARPLRVAAFFTMLFLSIANGGVSAANGLPRPTAPVSTFIHGSEIHMASNYQAPMAHFVDEWRADFDLAKLWGEAKDAVIAKVHASLVFAESNVCLEWGVRHCWSK